jgi:hypothetical protein
LPTPQRAGYGLKTRIYSVIVFLGFLPMLGAAVALVAMDLSRHNEADLDRAARGTIYLERVNGLVYAVVMESRGVYMYADWRAAEPFATNLIRSPRARFRAQWRKGPLAAEPRVHGGSLCLSSDPASSEIWRHDD